MQSRCSLVIHGGVGVIGGGPNHRFDETFSHQFKVLVRDFFVYLCMITFLNKRKQNDISFP